MACEDLKLKADTAQQLVASLQQKGRLAEFNLSNSQQTLANAQRDVNAGRITERTTLFINGTTFNSPTEYLAALQAQVDRYQREQDNLLSQFQAAQTARDEAGAAYEACQAAEAKKATDASKKQNNAGTGTAGTAGQGTGATPAATTPPTQVTTGATGATAPATTPSVKQTPEGTVPGEKTPEQEAADAEAEAQAELDAIEQEAMNPDTNQGMVQETRDQASMMDATKYAQAGDWRVRLSLADNANYLYKASPVGPLLAPLQDTNGIVFPYTPSISVAYLANYDTTALTHSNYRVVQYQNSAVENVTIGCDFTAQSVQEANYVLAVIHFLRSVTKMFYGQDNEPIRGTPPPLCYLTGLGQYNFSAHPLVITGFTYVLPTDVDYIRAVPQDPPPRDNSQVLSSLRIGQGDQSGASPGGLPSPPNFSPGSEPPTMVPTKINIQIQAVPVVARNTISNEFSVREYATGALLAGRNLTGGGIW